MKTINVFTMTEVKALKKQFDDPNMIKARRLGENMYILVRRKYNGGYNHHQPYEVSSLDLIIPSPEMLISAGIITAEEYRSSCY